MANDCKYQRKQYQISYDSGSTWHNAVPARYEKGELTEYSSPDCSGIEVQYRWRELEGQYICVDNNKYTKEIQEESYDNGATWYVSYPTVYKEGYFVEYNEEYCSFKFRGRYYYDEASSRCDRWYKWNGVRCVYIDPLKIVKCNNDGTLTQNEVSYYAQFYRIFSAEIGGCAKILSNRLFFYVTSLSSLTIDNGVETIGDSAFAGCSGLTSINIPDSVTSIGNYAFYSCTSLTSVTIGNGPTSIGDGAFQYCHGLTSITIPSGVTSIGNWAFIGCSGLTTATIESGSIGSSAFTYCSSLTSVTIGSGVTSIGTRAFKDCSGLTTTTIERGSIGDGAFQYCSGITSVTIGNGVTSIGDNAFDGCRSLTSITIPSGVTSIESYAFCYCTSLTSVTIGSGVTSIGVGAFIDCGNITTITCLATVPPTVDTSSFLFEGVRTIYVPCESVRAYKEAPEWGDYGGYIQGIQPCEEEPKKIKAFYRHGYWEKECESNTNLEYGEIPDTNMVNELIIGDCVTKIKTDEFSHATLTKLTIGTGITSITESAFNGCTGLTSITIYATTPPILASYAFYNTNNCPIYVPSGSVNTYKSASGWSSYSSRIQAIP